MELSHGELLAPVGLQALIDRLARATPATEAAELRDQLRLLESVKSAICAVQVRVTNAFVAARKAEQIANGARGERVGRGIAQEVGLAKRESPYRARVYVGFAKILAGELPSTFGAMARGETTEWRAMIVARETGWLQLEHRRAIDAEVGSQLGGWGDRQTAAEVKTRAYALDPQGMLDRISKAINDRNVTIRPAPDCMARVSALVPMKQGVAVYASLKAAADTKAGVAEDARTRAQVMADEFVERITGQAEADDVPVTVNVIIGADALLNAGAGKDDPGYLDGYGPIPAETARDLAYGRSRRGDDKKRLRWIRRLYTHPKTGQLVTMETRSRCFTEAQREFLRFRDQTCRMPYCDAPIRHADHITPAEDGGPTSLDNGQGLCEACNHARQAVGWKVRVTGDGDIEWISPTGHRQTSRPRFIGKPATRPESAGSRQPVQESPCPSAFSSAA